MRQRRIGLAIAAGESEMKNAAVRQPDPRRTLDLREEKIDIVPEKNQLPDARELFQRSIFDGAAIGIGRKRAARAFARGSQIGEGAEHAGS